MSPEQIAAAPTLDARSDIYSVGVLAYYLLTGRNPFDRPEVRDILAAYREDAPPLGPLAAGIHADLEQVVARCLAREPAGRFADAACLEQALAACRSAGVWTPADAWWREHAVLPPLRSLPLPNDYLLRLSQSPSLRLPMDETGLPARSGTFHRRRR
jgi:serine/threonine-protein kinase